MCFTYAVGDENGGAGLLVDIRSKINLKNGLAFLSIAPSIIWFFVALDTAEKIFFRTGAYFLDAGLFVHSLSSEVAPSLPPGTSLGNELFGLHTFFTAFATNQILGLTGISGVESFIYFLAIQTAAVSVLGSILGYLVAMGKKAWLKYVSSLSFGVFLPLSNISMGNLLYPHPEVFGAALGGLGFVAYFLTLRPLGVGPKASKSVYIRILRFLAFSLISASLLSREDLGLHIFLSLAAIGLLYPKFRGKLLPLAALSLVASISLFVIKATAFGDSPSLLQTMYLGDVPFAHLGGLDGLLARGAQYLTIRWDVIMLLGLSLLTMVVFKTRSLAAGLLAASPWLVINFLAVDPAKTFLNTYHQFPFIIYFFVVPVLASFLEVSKTDSGSSEASIRPSVVIHPVLWTLVVSGLSLPPQGSGYWLNSFPKLDSVQTSEITEITQKLKWLANKGAVFDDPSMSIIPQYVAPDKRLTSVSNDVPDLVVVMPEYVLGRDSRIEFVTQARNRGYTYRAACLSDYVSVLYLDKSTEDVSEIAACSVAVLQQLFPDT